MPDVFRREYKQLDAIQKEQMMVIKDEAQTLWDLIDKATTPANGREMATAKTRLQEAIMWAVNGITA